jgi:type II secretory pathway component PulK
MILAGAAATQHVAMRAQWNRMEERRARIAAQAGIQRAITELAAAADPAAQTATATGAVTLSDEWATLGQNGNEDFRIGSSSFRLEIVDASSLVNINTAAQEQLERLPLTPEQVDTLLDWREADRSPRSDGAKDEYYNSLENPYNAKLGRLNTVDELLLIKGFTPDVLWEPQENVTGVTLVQGAQEDQPVLIDLITVDSASQPVSASGQPRLNANTVTVQQMVARQIPANIATAIFQRRGSFTRVGQILALPGVTAQNARLILDNLAINSQTRVEGKINPNTATEAVLNSLPNMTPDIAAAIVARQGTGFTGLGDLVDVPGLNNMTLLQQLADFFEVRSTVFRIRVMGKAGQTTVPLEAIVEMLNGQPRLLRIEEPAYPDVVTRWAWQEEPTVETTLKEAA